MGLQDAGPIERAANGIEIPRPQRVVLSKDPGADLAGLAALGGPDQDDLAEGTD